MSWLDKFFSGGYAAIQIAGVNLPGEVTLNFVSGATGVDDPASGRTNVTISGGSGGGGSPTGAAGGDLKGTYPNPQVDGISTGTQAIKTTATIRAGSQTTHAEQNGSVVATCTGTTTARGFVGWQFSSNTASSTLYTGKARGTESAPLTTVNGDNVFQLIAAGYDGSAFISSAIWTAEIDGAVSAGVVPVGWYLYTGSSSSPSLRLRVSSAGVFDFQANELTNIHDATADTSAASFGQVKARARTSRITVPGAYPYTILATDESILVDTNSARTLNLPNPALLGSFRIKDKNGLSSTNNITLHRFGAEKIELVAADKPLAAGGGGWLIETDGTDWYITGPL